MDRNPRRSWRRGSLTFWRNFAWCRLRHHRHLCGARQSLADADIQCLGGGHLHLSRHPAWAPKWDAGRALLRVPLPFPRRPWLRRHGGRGHLDLKFADHRECKGLVSSCEDDYHFRPPPDPARGKACQAATRGKAHLLFVFRQSRPAFGRKCHGARCRKAMIADPLRTADQKERDHDQLHREAPSQPYS